jgi:hypothetical protein
MTHTQKIERNLTILTAFLTNKLDATSRLRLRLQSQCTIGSQHPAFLMMMMIRGSNE